MCINAHRLEFLGAVVPGAVKILCMHNIVYTTFVGTTMNQKKSPGGGIEFIEEGIEFSGEGIEFSGYQTKKGVLNSQVPPSIDEKTIN